MEDRRKYARVTTHFFGRFRVLNSHSEPQICAGAFCSTGHAVREIFASQSQLPESVTKFLLELDNKLESVLGILRKDALEELFSHKMRVLDISAGGIVMQTDFPLEIGQYLEVVLHMGDFPFRMASGVGRIIRHADKGGNKGLVLEFTDLREEDREEIIHYVFQEERRKLRKQRLEE